MSVLTSPSLRVVLYESTGSRPLADAHRSDIFRTLLPKGFSVSCVRSGGPLSATDSGTLVVLGQFDEPKPVRATNDDSNVNVFFKDIDGMESSAILEYVDGIRNESEIPKPGTWKPWFPVIDYSRCTNCMQCLSFCLFDVYAVSTDGKIQVRNQSNCKTDCPACSRVCPEVAILFPKYRSGPINGDVVNLEDVRREAMKVDISALLGGDIYEALRTRSERAKSRFAKERDPDRALKERQKCLVKLQQQLDIPPEVLASLPSLDQIQAKAEEAKKRAEEALSMQGRDKP